ncbi:MAG: lysophospholipid acyltransferase family protein [Hyphomicrobiaceae bacterium]
MRAASILAGFAALTVPLLPVQALLLRSWPRAARLFPHWYHRKVCRLFGLRLHIEGEVVRDRPVLLVANHTSWLDITVLSAVAPVSFVAKSEVGTWPGVRTLARLQRTVFVDRERRTSVGETANEIISRLGTGDAIVLFAEGTSSDGNRVLPFRTSLFAAVKPPPSVAQAVPGAVVQTVAIVYTGLHGVPLDRQRRPLVGWFGDMELQSHAMELLNAGPLDVRVIVGPPVPLDAFADRKALAQHSETEVRGNVVRALRGLEKGHALDVTTPTAKPAPPRRRRADADRADKWV